MYIALRGTGQRGWRKMSFSVSATCNKVVNHINASVHIIPTLSDNYSYIVVESDSGTGTVIDVGESRPVIAAVEKLMNAGSLSELKYALCTHHHHDHVGGNKDLATRFPAIEIYGTGYEDIPHRTKSVRDGDVFLIGRNMKIDTIYTPCHTSGHVCYSVSSTDQVNKPLTPMLFSGDTLFVGGCGRFFEGSPAQMLANMSRLSRLPIETKVYCGHEYTVSNMRFLSSLYNEKNRQGDASTVLACYYNKYKQMRDDDIPTIPSTIGDELRYNLFMQCEHESTQQLVGGTDAIDTMHRLRELKNIF